MNSQILRHRAAQQAAAAKQGPKMHWYEDLRAAQKERMRQAGLLGRLLALFSSFKFYWKRFKIHSQFRGGIMNIF